MWNNKKVSVILPAFNEEKNIARAIEDFSLPFVDEIIVIDNNSTDRTAEEVLKTKKARLFNEKRQGYGFSLQAGYIEANGDYIITAEPDGTFLGRDMLKLLAYAEDFEAVFGTRTNKTLVWEGANMHFLLLAGNWAVAKLMEFLFNTHTLSDVGCTMKLLNREALAKIKDQFTVGGNHFSPELMLLAIINKLNFIEVPVNYKRRIGISKITGNMINAIRLGLRMICLIFKYRVSTLFRQRRDESEK
jgi:glycosyltransferase involved in cell wall biosynthesis